MMFHSTPFLGLLAATYALYWLAAPYKWPRLVVLLVGSVVFYAAWNPAPLLIFAASCIVNFGCGHLLERTDDKRQRKAILIGAICFHLGGLIIYKYLALFFSSLGSLAAVLHIDWQPKPLGLLLPIGLSFVTFTAISFVTDVYRRETSGKHSLLHQFVFMLFFARVVAGPIIRAKVLLEPLDRWPRVTHYEASEGLFRIGQGIAKKLLMADVLAVSLVDPVFTNPTGYSGLECVLASIAYTFQIYFDFSGYSDIALGVAALFGFKFPENFNKPYHATNLFEFWNGWHVTLSTWLRDYLYRPLGGNQGSRAQTLRNTMLVMSLGGLWHGADWRFLLWGGIHGVLLMLWRIWWWQVGKPKKGEASFPRQLGGWLMMFNAVVFARVFFRADSMALASGMFKQMFTLTTNLARVSSTAWLSFAACIVLYALPRPVFDQTRRLFVNSPAWVRAAALLALGLVIRQISSLESKPYIYFQY
jgi:D-alanyl-lipoteichoic acid acyltransferase DltB (MBOAT superfamily)